MAKGTRWDLLVNLKTKGTQGLKAMGNSMQGLQGRLKNVRNAALSVNTAFRAMAVILTAGAFSKFITGAIDQADAFGKLSRQTGIAADELQSYVNAGKLAGVEQATIEKSLRRLAQSMREADQEVATYADAYKALGITVRDSEGNLKESEVVLGELADRFRNMPDGATKAAIAMEIFGRSGSQIIPMLNEGSAALKEWNYETSEGFAANAEYFNDQLTMIGFGFDGFRKQLADALLPALNAMLEVFRDIFSAENDFSGFFSIVEGGIRAIAATVYGFGRIIQEVGIFTTKIIQRIKEGMQWLSDNTPDWVKKIAGGTKDLVQDLGNRAVSMQVQAMDSVFGDNFGSDYRDRLKNDMEVINKLISGESEAGENYHHKGKEGVAAVGAELTKTFGGQMQTKLDSFSKKMSDFGGMVADVVTKAFTGLEDQLVSFATTGKMEFKKLAQSIIADITRIAIRASITKPLMGMFGFNFDKNATGGVFSNGTKLTRYAKGGVVDRPTMFAMGGQGNFGLMSESGPEAIMPLKRGKGGRLGVEGGGGTSVVVNVDASGGTEVSGSEEQARMLGQAVAAAVRTQIANERRPGGLLYA
jgi:hypothetical protein